MHRQDIPVKRTSTLNHDDETQRVLLSVRRAAVLPLGVTHRALSRNVPLSLRGEAEGRDAC